MAKEVRGSDNKQIKLKNTAMALRSAIGAHDNPRFIAPKQMWSDLDEIYKATAESIVATGEEINGVITVPGIRDCIADKTEFSDAVKGLSRDLNTFTDKLLEIKKTHEGCTGEILTPKDNAKAIEVFDKYVQLSTQFKAVTLPTVISIMDHVSQAYNKLAKDLGIEEKVNNDIANEQAAAETAEVVQEETNKEQA